MKIESKLRLKNVPYPLVLWPISTLNQTVRPNAQHKKRAHTEQISTGPGFWPFISCLFTCPSLARRNKRTSRVKEDARNCLEVFEVYLFIVV